MTIPLPQPGTTLFITEPGMATDLLYIQGVDLPEFAVFPLLETDDGRQRMGDYSQQTIDIARQHGYRVMLETATWRASPDWGAKLGYSNEQIIELTRESVRFSQAIADRNPDVTCIVSGTVGPRGDAYLASTTTAEQSLAYHGPQVAALAEAGADLVTAYTVTDVGEIIGIVHAAQAAKVPVGISLTVETDGSLPDGGRLADAITEVDERTDNAVLFYMINCAHPTHFIDLFREPGPWDRIWGLQPNASTKSHAELDVATELDSGDPDTLAAECVDLRNLLPNLALIGGCCGTDMRHLAAITAALANT